MACPFSHVLCSLQSGLCSLTPLMIINRGRMYKSDLLLLINNSTEQIMIRVNTLLRADSLRVVCDNQYLFYFYLLLIFPPIGFDIDKVNQTEGQLKAC